AQHGDRGVDAAAWRAAVHHRSRGRRRSGGYDARGDPVHDRARCRDDDHRLRAGYHHAASRMVRPLRPSRQDLPVTRTRIAVLGLGMGVTPHAKGLIDLADQVEVAYAFSPSEARRSAFAERFPFPLTDRLETILD